MERVRAARGALVAAAATIAVSLWFGAQPAIDCGSGPVSSRVALGAFQMARSQAELDAAIGCNARLAVLNAMNRVDLLAFIASWGLFLIFATLALTHGRLRRIALTFFAVALAGDVVETATQLWIGGRWPFVTTQMLALLAVGSTAKWAGIGLGLGAAGLDIAREHRGLARWLGDAVAVFGVLGLAVFVMPAPPPFIAIAWLALLTACALNARRAAPRTSAAA